MKKSDTNALESMDFAKNYNNYILKKILGNLNEGKIVDFGAGYGTFSEMLISLKKDVTAVEVDEEAIKILDKKGIKNTENLYSQTELFENIISLNVLEHIEDDQETLDSLFKSMKISGKLILYLPASMLAWSYIDEWVNHKRRYTKNNLSEKVQKAGFNILSAEYVDFIGWIGIIFMKLIRYEPALNEKKIVFYDKYIFKPFRFFDFIFKNIIGKNIFLVAEKPSNK